LRAALVLGGLYWLGVLVLDMTGRLIDGYQGPTTTVRSFKMVIMVPTMMIVAGGFWLWEDIYGPPPRRKG
jgi:hypothetical protein